VVSNAACRRRSTKGRSKTSTNYVCVPGSLWRTLSGSGARFLHVLIRQADILNTNYAISLECVVVVVGVVGVAYNNKQHYAMITLRHTGDVRR